MNNRQVISIGVQLDYKKQLESMLSDLRKNLDDLRKTSVDIEVSKSLQKQIEQTKSEIERLTTYIDDQFTKMGNNNIDISRFTEFQKSVSDQFDKIGKEIRKVSEDASNLSKLMSTPQGDTAVTQIITDYKNLKKQIEETTRIANDLFNITRKTGKSGIISFKQFSVDDAEKAIKTINDYQNSNGTNPYSSNSKQLMKQQDDQRDLAKKYRDTLHEYASINKEINESIESGVPKTDPYISFLKARRSQMQIEINQIAKAILELDEMLGESTTIDEKNRSNIKKNAGVMLNQQEIDKTKRNLEDAIGEKVVQDFKITNGAIQVPLRISTTPSALKEELERTVSKIQSSVKPIEIEVKMKSVSARGPAGKATVSSAEKEMTDEMKKAIASSYEDVATGEELDLGKAFEKTYSTTVKAAEMQAKAAIAAIRAALQKEPIKLTPKIEIDDKAKNEVKNLFGGESAEALTKSVTSLSDALVNIMTGDEVVKFLEYFTAEWRKAVGQGGSVETTLLTALNNATDQWKNHFLEVFKSIGTLINLDDSQETKDKVAQKINLDFDEQTIINWKNSFQESINQIANHLQSSLSSSSVAAVDAWRNAMNGAIAEVGNVMPNVPQAINANPRLAMNELAYNLMGWHEGDDIIAEHRKGTALDKYDSTIESWVQHLTATIQDKFVFTMTDLLSDDAFRAMFNNDSGAISKVAKILYRYADTGSPNIRQISNQVDKLFNNGKISRAYTGELERGGLYNIKNGKMYGGYTYDQDGSYSFKTDIKDSLLKEFHDDLSDFIDIHSHPSNRQGETSIPMVGTDLNYSGADMRAFKARMNAYGIKRYMVESNGEVGALDMSKVPKAKAIEIIDRIAEYVDKSPGWYHFHDKKYVTEDNPTGEYINMTTTSRQREKATRKIIDEVIGQNGASEAIYKVGKVEELQDPNSKFKSFFPQGEVQQETNSINTLISAINELKESIKSIPKIELDSSGFGPVIEALKRIFDMLHSINQIAGTALADFSISGISKTSNSKAKYNKEVKGFVDDYSKIIKRSVANQDYDSELDTVFREFYKIEQTFPKVANFRSIASSIFGADDTKSLNTIEHLYDTYKTRVKDIVNIKQQMAQGQPVNIGETILNLDEKALAPIIESLKEIQKLMQTAFDLSDAGKLESKFAKLKTGFNSLVNDPANLTKSSTLNMNKAGVKKWLSDLNEYYSMGGSKSYSEILKDVYEPQKDSKLIAEQSKKIQGYLDKQVAKGAGDSSGGELGKELQGLGNIAVQLPSQIQPVIDILNNLNSVLTVNIPNGDSFKAALEGISSALSAISPDSIKNLKSLLGAFSGKKFANFQVPAGFDTMIKSIEGLSTKSDDLANLAKIISNTKGANLDPKSLTARIGQDDYSAIQDLLVDQRDMDLASRYTTVGNTNIQRLKDGIVELTTVVQDNNGAWKELRATIDSDWNIVESGMKSLTEDEARKKMGGKKNGYDPTGDLNELGSLYKKVNQSTEEYLRIRAKVDKTRIDVSSREQDHVAKVEDSLREIAILEQRLEANNVDIRSSKIGGLYSTFQAGFSYDFLNDSYDANKANPIYEAVSGRASLFAKQINQGAAAVQNLVSSLNTIQGSGDVISQVNENFKVFVSDLLNGSIGAEKFKEKWGQLVTKYKDVVGFYTGNMKDQGAEVSIEKELRSRLEQFTGRTDLDFGKGMQTLSNGTDRVIAKIKEADGTVKSFTATLDRNTGAIRVSQSGVGQYVNGLDKFISSLKAKLQEGLRYLMAYVSIQDLWRYFREGVGVVKQYDAALTEMRKVSDESVTSLQRLQQQSFSWADDVGTTAIDLQKSIADFMRLGQETDKAIDSAKTANILLNVSEFESINDATTSLIAMEQAYQELSGTQIIDKLNEIGNNYAISTDQLSVALQNSASALTVAGNSMDEAVAIVTAGNALIQDASKSGTGINTIALRLTGTKEAKAQLEELGEETDDLITTQSKLRDLILNATKVESNAFKGFDILNDDGSYKSTYEMLLGIAEIWEEIGKRDKATGNLNQNLLLESVAGKRRANIAASIFQNPELLRSVLESSQNAEGSAQEELDKYLDSIEGKMQQFSNATQQLAVDLIDNETVKGFVDFGRQAIEVIDGIAKHIPLITTAIAGLMTVITSKTGAQIFTFGRKDDGSFGMVGNIIESLKTRGVQWSGADARAFSAFDEYANNKGITKTNIAFANFIKLQEKYNAKGKGLQLSDEMKKTADSIINTSDAYQQAIVSQESFSRQAVKSGSIVGSLKNTFANLGSSILSGLASFGVSTLVTLAIQGIGQLIDYLWETPEEIKEAGKAAQDEFNKIQDDIDNTKKSAESLGDAYNRLSKGVDTSTNKNLSLSTEEYDEYIDTVNQIVELSPSFKDGIDSQGNAIVTFSEQMGDATAALDEFIEREEHLAAIEQSRQAYDIIRGEIENQKEYQSQIEELEKQQGQSSIGVSGETGSEIIQKRLREYLSGQSSIFEISAEEIREMGDNWQDYKRELVQYLYDSGFAINTLSDTDQGFMFEKQAGPANIDVDSFVDGFSTTVRGLVDRIQYEADNASDQMKEVSDQSELSWGNAIDAAFSWINENSTFRGFSDEMQTAISNSLSTLDFNSLINQDGPWKDNAFNEDEMRAYVIDNYLNPISHAFGSAYESTHNAEDVSALQGLLEQLFTIDTSEIKAPDYIKQVTDIITKIAKYDYFNEIGINALDFAIKYNLVPKLELTIDGKSAKYYTYGDAIKALLSDREFNNAEGLGKYVDSMTVQQQVEVYEKLSNGKFTNAEIATSIVGVVEESLKETTDYLGAYTTRKAKETAEAFTNAIAAVTNEVGNVSAGTIDKDFAQFVGGYEDDLVTSMINIEENAQRAQKYFTEDGLGIYSFAADAIDALDAVSEHEKLLTEGWNADSDAHAERLFETLENTGLIGEEGIEINGQTKSLDAIVDDAVEAYQRYIQVLEDAKEVGYEVAYGEQGQSIFGNVDLSQENRLIEWNEQNLKKYSNALKSLGQDVNEFAPDSISTVLGGYGEYGKDSVKIAFSPVFYNPDKNRTSLLTQSQIDGYINNIVAKLESEGKTVDLKNVLSLDDHGLIADVGETSPETARKMHYAGINGAVELARKQLIDIGNTIDEGYGEAFLNLMADTDESIIKIGKHGNISFKRTERGLKKLADRMNMSDEEAGVLLDSLIDLGNISYDSIFFNAMQNQINDTTSDVNALSAALQEMGSQGYLSSQTMKDLLAANPDYSNLLIHTVGGTMIDPNDVRHQVERDTVARIDEINKIGWGYAEKLQANRKAQMEAAASDLGIPLDKIKEKSDEVSQHLAEMLQKPSEYPEWADALNLETENKQLDSYIQGLVFLRQELFGSISLMKEYKDALQTPNISDNYNTIVSGLEDADKLAEQGWWGKDDFVTYANILAGYNEEEDRWESESEAIENYIANRDHLKKYMTEDTSGLFNFANDALNKGQITRMIDPNTGEEIANSFNFDAIEDIREFSKAMDMQVETATNFLLAIRDAGGEINLEGLMSTVSRNLSDSYNDFAEGKKTAEEYIEDFTQLNGAFQVLSENGIEVSQEVKEATNAAIMSAADTIPVEMTKQVTEFGDKIGEAAYEYQGYIYQLNEVGNVTSSFSTNMLTAAQTASGLNEVLSHTDAKSTEAEAAISTYAETLNNLSQQERIKLGIEIDENETDHEARIEQIKQQIQAQVDKNGKVEVPADIDLSQFTEEPVDMTVAISQSSIDGIRDAITQALADVTAEPNVDMDKAQQQAIANPLQIPAVANTTNTPSAVISASATLDTTNVTSQVSNINKLSAAPQVGLNTREFATSLSAVNSALNTLSRSYATPRALLDTSSFATSISAVATSLNSLNGKSSTVYIKTVKQTGKDIDGDGKIDKYETGATGTFFPQSGAYAGGTNVGVRKNEKALVNEVGQESLVRDGKWSLIPGGAHFENLKRGDINYSVRT